MVTAEEVTGGPETAGGTTTPVKLGLQDMADRLVQHATRLQEAVRQYQQFREAMQGVTDVVPLRVGLQHGPIVQIPASVAPQVWAALYAQLTQQVLANVLQPLELLQQESTSALSYCQQATARDTRVPAGN